MPLEPLSPVAFALIAQMEEIFATLLRWTAPGETPAGASGLGGKLLYAGELDAPGRAFTAAANIAGAATLAASSDPAAGKQAMRDGIVDFLVNSLDEALRILKNQVRKRETVAVCVSAAPAAIEAEMNDRGVVPDLDFPRGFTGALAHWEDLTAEASRSEPLRARLRGHHAPLESVAAAGEETAEKEEKIWLTWRVSETPALWLPMLDALALDSLPSEERAARRWLERAPRYLGRLAQNARTLRVTQQQAGQILARFSAAAIAVPIEITLGPWGESARVDLREQF
jgi:hypothetical protein